MRTRKGFTLIELLVVITIILILAAAMAVFIKHMIERSRNTATKGLIDLLNKACDEYKTQFGGFPPAAPWTGSQNLHAYLGGPRIVVTSYSSAGNITETLPPMIEFKKQWLAPGAASTAPNPPSQIYDAYGGIVEYSNPGVNNPKGVDLRSKGRDQADATDDITNWVRDW